MPPEPLLINAFTEDENRRSAVTFKCASAPEL